VSATLKMVGMDKLAKRLDRIGGEVAQQVADQVSKGALRIQNDMRRAVQKGPATGRTYTHGGVSHRASAPGEAPASDSGNLASHINHIFKDRFTAEVGAIGVPYAARLEFGGKDSKGRYIAPRPYLRPALKKNGPKITKAISAAVKEALHAR